MSFITYTWFMPIGFWLTIGIIMAIGAASCVWFTISKVVDFFWKETPKIKPPKHIANLTSSTGKDQVTVYCTAFDKAYVHSEFVASHGSVSAALEAAHIELFARIAEEHDGSEHH